MKNIILICTMLVAFAHLGNAQSQSDYNTYFFEANELKTVLTVVKDFYTNHPEAGGGVYQMKKDGPIIWYLPNDLSEYAEPVSAKIAISNVMEKYIEQLSKEDIPLEKIRWQMSVMHENIESTLKRSE